MVTMQITFNPNGRVGKHSPIDHRRRAGLSSTEFHWEVNMKRFSKKVAILSIAVQGITNIAGYALAVFLILDAIYMECIEKVAPVLVAPTFFAGLIALAGMILYSKFIIWSAREYVAPMMKRNRH